MKTITGSIIAAASLMVAFAAGFSQNLPFSAAQASDDAERAAPFRLVGTWLSEVTFVSCSDGTPLGLPFLALNSFAVGQTSSEFGVASGNLRGPGYGTWQRLGASQFSAPMMFFRFDATGVQVMDIATTQRTITMTSPDQYESENTTEFRNVDGVLLFTGCATEAASRL